MSQRVIDAILFPLLSMLIIAAFAGGLGVLFIVIEHSAMGLVGVIVLGVGDRGGRACRGGADPTPDRALAQNRRTTARPPAT